MQPVLVYVHNVQHAHCDTGAIRNRGQSTTWYVDGSQFSCHGGTHLKAHSTASGYPNRARKAALESWAQGGSNEPFREKLDLFGGVVIAETSLLWPGRKDANLAHKEVYRDTASVFVHV
jgi:hypothetical protein